MNSFLRRLKSHVGPWPFRIFKLYALHEWRRVDIARRLGLSRSTVTRHIQNVERAARSIARAIGAEANIPGLAR